MPSPPDILLRRLEWHVLRRLDGQLQGAYRTVFRGAGLDFTGLREYTPSDDVRHIDWNVTARLDEPYVRQYTADRELTAWLVLDRSASMRIGGGNGKDSVLTELAACLGRMFTVTGNRVGAILYDNRFQRIVPPRTGRDHIRYLATELGRPAAVDPDSRTIDLAAMLHLAAATVRRRSLVFVISDFIGDRDWEPALIRLGQRHEVVTVRIVDPMEFDLPDLGLILVEDAETGEQLLADTGDPVFRRRLRAGAEARERAVAGSMRRAGVAAHRLDTTEDLTRALIRMVRGSKRGPT
jgi:uncharacterized protein (DUF58 family)